jgi:hypothetical protein
MRQGLQGSPEELIMAEARGTDSGLSAPIGAVSRVGARSFAPKSRLSRSPPTPLLRFQPASSDEVQVPVLLKARQCLLFHRRARSVIDPYIRHYR